VKTTNKFIKGFTSQTTATAVAIVMMLSSVLATAMLITIVTAETLLDEPIPHTARYKMVTTGVANSYSLGIRLDGTMWAWGGNGSGELGIGDSTSTIIGSYGMEMLGVQSPVQVGIHNDWVYVTSGGSSSFGIRADGSLWAWGSNWEGILGIGEGDGIGHYNQWGSFQPVHQFSPVQVGTDTDWVHVSASYDNTLGIKKDGSLWVWGSNNRGGLGGAVYAVDENGNLLDYDEDGNPLYWFCEWCCGLQYTEVRHQIRPVRLGTDTWKITSSGHTHYLAIRSDGTLWSWGENYRGSLGIGDTDNRYELTQVGEHNDWVHVSAGNAFSTGIRADGSLWSWGLNWAGSLGLGDAGWGTERYFPTRVGVDTDWKYTSAGRDHTLGIRNNGSLWAWGYNGGPSWWEGHLGTGDTEQQNSPVRVGTETDWIDVAAHNIHSSGIRSDGSLWVWGDSSYGQLGIGVSGDGAGSLVPFGPTAEQLEPLPKDPPPDLSYVNIGSDDDNKAFVDIDEERIEDEKLTFRWWRRVGNGEWEELDVPPNQPWVDIELDDDDDVTYKVDIYVDNEFLLARSRTFSPPSSPPPPPPGNRFYGFAIPTAIAICIAFVCLITLIVIIIIRRREEQKNKAKAGRV